MPLVEKLLYLVAKIAHKGFVHIALRVCYTKAPSGLVLVKLPVSWQINIGGKVMDTVIQ
jgi:hypothetical protein